MIDLAEARRIARSYPPGAANVPHWERERFFTETQQLGWLLRFEPSGAELMIARQAGVMKTIASSPHA